MNSLRLIFSVFATILFANTAWCQRAEFSNGETTRLRAHTFPTAFGYLHMRYLTTANSKTVSLSFTSVDQKTTTVLPVQNGLVEHDVLFNRSGIYRYALRDATALLDSGEIEIQINEITSPIFTTVETYDETVYAELAPQDNPDDPMYFIASQVSFSDRLDEAGNAVPTADAFYIDRDGSIVNVIVQNTKPLATDAIVIDIYMLRGKKQRYVDTRHYDVDPEALSVSLPYTFVKPGTYIFKVFSGNDVWIENGTIAVKSR